MQFILFDPFDLPPSHPVPLRDRRLAFGDTHGHSINSVRYTIPFHGRVYRQ